MCAHPDSIYSATVLHGRPVPHLPATYGRVARSMLVAQTTTPHTHRHLSCGAMGIRHARTDGEPHRQHGGHKQTDRLGAHLLHGPHYLCPIRGGRPPDAGCAHRRNSHDDSGRTVSVRHVCRQSICCGLRVALRVQVSLHPVWAARQRVERTDVAVGRHSRGYICRMPVTTGKTHGACCRLYGMDNDCTVILTRRIHSRRNMPAGNARIAAKDNDEAPCRHYHVVLCPAHRRAVSEI